MDADSLFKLLAAGEPPEIRNTYIATPDPSRFLHQGSTVPQLGLFFTARDSGLVAPVPRAHDDLLKSVLVYMTLEDMTGIVLSAAEKDSFMAGLDRETLVAACALLLGIVHDGNPTDGEAQARIAATICPDLEPHVGHSLCDQVARRLKNGEMFLAPQALLGLMKRALVEARGSNCNLGVALKSAVLLSLDLASGLGVGTELSGYPTMLGGIATPMAMHLIQNQMYNHKSELGCEIARWKRTRELGEEYNPSAASDFDSNFRSATGCDPEVLFQVGVYLQLKAGNDPQRRVDPRILDQMIYPKGETDAAVNLLAADASHLADLISEESSAFGDEWTANAVRRFPFLRCQDGTLVMLHSEFVIQRICATGYVLEVLQELNRMRTSDDAFEAKRGKKLYGQFRSFTGHTAEEYAADRLAQISPPAPFLGQTLWREDELKVLWSKEGGRVCDFLIDAGDCWIVMDVVNRPLREQVQAGGSEEFLEEDLALIIDEKADQIEATIERLKANGGSLPGRPPRSVPPRYFPVIVAAAGFPWNPVTAEAIHRRLSTGAPKRLQGGFINPLTVISMDHLVHIEGAVEQGSVTFAQMLEERRSARAEGQPFDTYLHDRGLNVRPKSLNPHWEAPLNDTAKAFGLELIDGGDEGHKVVEPGGESTGEGLAS